VPKKEGGGRSIFRVWKKTRKNVKGNLIPQTFYLTISSFYLLDPTQIPSHYCLALKSLRYGEFVNDTHRKT
jgi:hypothetical protein